MGMGGCCFSDGAIPGSILLFWTVDIRVVSVSWSCVELFMRSGVIMGLSGFGWLLDFVFGVALGYGSRGMGSLGLFVRGCGF